MSCGRDKLLRFLCASAPERIGQLFSELTHEGFPKKKNMFPGLHFDQLKFHLCSCSCSPTHERIIHIVVRLLRPLKYRDLSPKLRRDEGRPGPISCWPLTS